MASKESRKHVVLTIEQKLQVCDSIRKGDSYAEITKKFNIGKSTISDIKRSEQKLKDFKSEKSQLGIKNAAKKSKCMKSAGNEELDRALYIWFRQLREKNIPVSGPILLEKVSLNLTCPVGKFTLIVSEA